HGRPAVASIPCSCRAHAEFVPDLAGSMVKPKVTESPTARYQGWPATGGRPATGVCTEVCSGAGAGSVAPGAVTVGAGDGGASAPLPQALSRMAAHAAAGRAPRAVSGRAAPGGGGRARRISRWYARPPRGPAVTRVAPRSIGPMRWIGH